mmetsp:Transcript_29648/g.88043  ORF Transcript_29648/g.88043 Transcript_29648/m.88043 type:complete len:448 (+) Transcript_29648:648-1991(+)
MDVLHEDERPQGQEREEHDRRADQGPDGGHHAEEDDVELPEGDQHAEDAEQPHRAQDAQRGDGVGLREELAGQATDHDDRVQVVPARVEERAALHVETTRQLERVYKHEQKDEPRHQALGLHVFALLRSGEGVGRRVALRFVVHLVADEEKVDHHHDAHQHLERVGSDDVRDPHPQVFRLRRFLLLPLLPQAVAVTRLRVELVNGGRHLRFDLRFEVVNAVRHLRLDPVDAVRQRLGLPGDRALHAVEHRQAAGPLALEDARWFAHLVIGGRNRCDRAVAAGVGGRGVGGRPLPLLLVDALVEFADLAQAVGDIHLHEHHHRPDVPCLDLDELLDELRVAHLAGAVQVEHAEDGRELLLLDVHGRQEEAELLVVPVPLVELLQDDHAGVVDIHPGAVVHQRRLPVIVPASKLLRLQRRVSVPRVLRPLDDDRQDQIHHAEGNADAGA